MTRWFQTVLERYVSRSWVAVDRTERVAGTRVGSSPTRSAWLRDRRVGQKMLDLNVCGVEYRSEGRLVSRHI
jgi:hypothetical protein